MAKPLKDMLSQRKPALAQPRAVSVSDIIKQEEIDTANNKTAKLNQYFSDRSNVRKSISN
jgi:hypothetical protein